VAKKRAVPTHLRLRKERANLSYQKGGFKGIRVSFPWKKTSRSGNFFTLEGKLRRIKTRVRDSSELKGGRKKGGQQGVY